MSELSVILKGEEAQLWAQLNQVIQKTREIEKGFEDAGRTSERASDKATAAWRTQQREAGEGVRIVSRLEKEGQTLEQRYDSMRQKITQAWNQGKIDSKKYADSLVLLDQEFDRVRTSQNEVEQGNEQAFGAGALQKLAAAASGFLSISAAISAARQALEEYNAEREKGRSETERLTDARRRLFQVSEGDFGALEERADKAAATYGVDRGLARQVLFTARSEGFENEYESVLRLTPIIDPQSAGTVAGQVRNMFSKEGVGVQESISAVLAAARKSRLDFEGITKALPQVGEGGSLQGAGLSESLAALSVLASEFKTGETAADRIKALLTKMSLDKGGPESDEDFQKRVDKEHQRATTAQKKLKALEQRVADAEAAYVKNQTPEKLKAKERAAAALGEFDRGSAVEAALTRDPGRPGLAGRGLIGGMEGLLAMEEGDRKDFLKDAAELNVAYGKLKTYLDQIKARTAEIDAARTEQGQEALMQEFYSQPTLLEHQRAQAAVADRQTAAEQALSGGLSRNQAYRDYLNARLSEQGESASGRWASNRLMGMMDFMGYDIASYAPPEDQAKFNQYLEDMKKTGAAGIDEAKKTNDVLDKVLQELSQQNRITRPNEDK